MSAATQHDSPPADARGASSWAVLPPSGQTRDNKHRLLPEVNRHPKMVEENEESEGKKEKLGS